MPRPSPHTLIWSEMQHYELHTREQAEQYFRREDKPAFSGWLAEHSAFAFWGQAGRLSVNKEARDSANLDLLFQALADLTRRAMAEQWIA
jgi:LuxR family maltose regulon positive regulatory protein